MDWTKHKPTSESWGCCHTKTPIGYICIEQRYFDSPFCAYIDQYPHKKFLTESQDLDGCKSNVTAYLNNLSEKISHKANN